MSILIVFPNTLAYDLLLCEFKVTFKRSVPGFCISRTFEQRSRLEVTPSGKRGNAPVIPGRAQGGIDHQGEGIVGPLEKAVAPQVDDIERAILELLEE